MYWRDSTGEKHDIRDMSLEYLRNVRNLIDKWADEGKEVYSGDLWLDDDIFCDLDVIYGEEVRRMYGYYEIVKEIERRQQ